ncbi:hypothetical protein Bhyg_01935 [Pseudolycoriella hygida]|uniref:Uncharacterized protein n=1 Tax=Pseudolycoriella hygida TaxID=35572 RepID=A0A9Q0NB61_9DIPT|nr:hypothetical protein Bhyg_01935 [Pseudolycoriella hygida]
MRSLTSCCVAQPSLLNDRLTDECNVLTTEILDETLLSVSDTNESSNVIALDTSALEPQTDNMTTEQLNEEPSTFHGETNNCKVSDAQYLERRFLYEIETSNESTSSLNGSPSTTPLVEEEKEISAHKLSADWFIANFEFLELTRKKENGKMRCFIHCKICREFENVAKSHSKNGSVPLSNGIRVDSQEKLHRIVTHMEGKSHEEAAKAKIYNDLWNQRSESHV